MVDVIDTNCRFVPGSGGGKLACREGCNLRRIKRPAKTVDIPSGNWKAMKVPISLFVSATASITPG